MSLFYFLNTFMNRKNRKKNVEFVVFNGLKDRFGEKVTSILERKFEGVHDQKE